MSPTLKSFIHNFNIPTHPSKSLEILIYISNISSPTGRFHLGHLSNWVIATSIFPDNLLESFQCCSVNLTNFAIFWGEKTQFFWYHNIGKKKNPWYLQPIGTNRSSYLLSVLNFLYSQKWQFFVGRTHFTVKDTVSKFSFNSFGNSGNLPW